MKPFLLPEENIYCIDFKFQAIVNQFQRALNIIWIYCARTLIYLKNYVVINIQSPFLWQKVESLITSAVLEQEITRKVLICIAGG